MTEYRSQYINGYVFPKTKEEKKAQFEDKKKRFDWFKNAPENNQKGALTEFSGSIEIDGRAYYLDVSPLYDSQNGKPMRKVTLKAKTGSNPEGAAEAPQQEALDDDFEDDIPF